MPNLYTIDPTLPFASTLAQTVLDQHSDGRADVSHVMILLPNRRLCRSVTDAFIELSDCGSLLLPRILPIGDLDSDDVLFGAWANEQMAELPRVMSPTEQRLLLTELIESWQKATKPEGQHMSLIQSANLAIELANFLTDVEKEQLSLSDLEHVVPDQYAEHWQMTFEFLRILFDHWPNILAEHGMVDAPNYCNDLLALQSKHWQINPPNYPVIAAGSTGSIPATSELIRVISQLPNGNGVVVLPGLDQHMDDECWDVLEPSHSQFGLKQLLERLDVSRQSVQSLCMVDQNNPVYLRSKMLSLAMVPALHTHDWYGQSGISKQALEGFQCLTASSSQEEAELIALTMRQKLEKPDQTTALVTHDRTLAKMVHSLLISWDIQVDDSAGKPLADTPVMIFLRLIIDVMDHDVSVISLLALLKHPFARVGGSGAVCRHMVRMLEHKALRGRSLDRGGLYAYEPLVKALDNEEMSQWFASLCDILNPFLSLKRQKSLSIQAFLNAHIRCAKALAHTDDIDGSVVLFGHNEGDDVAAWLDDVLASSGRFRTIHPLDYKGLFDALSVGRVYRSKFGTHPRLFILSPMEARMQQYDTVILGGLNEGSWPPLPAADPWMSRPMRTNFGLPQPERRIGMSAHDFVQLACGPNVLLTRSEKDASAQTIPSRWLARIDVLLAASGFIKSDYAAKEPYQWHQSWMRYSDPTPCLEPRPAPSNEARPKQYSVTNIERLMRDPYSIYASKILGLYPLDPLNYKPSVADFGNFIHDVLDRFVTEYTDYEALLCEELESQLMCLGEHALNRYRLDPVSKAFWWSRFQKIAHWFAPNERRRRLDPALSLVHSEVKAQYDMMIGGDRLTLVAKADRIETHALGHSIFVDYKTGMVPSKRAIHHGIASQMVLEGLMSTRGAFDNINMSQPDQLLYWQFGTTGLICKEISIGSPIEIKALMEEADEGLQRLLHVFMDADTPYLSVPNPDYAPRYNDYEHLARVKEWSVLVVIM